MDNPRYMREAKFARLRKLFEKGKRIVERFTDDVWRNCKSCRVLFFPRPTKLIKFQIYCTAANQIANVKVRFAMFVKRMGELRKPCDVNAQKIDQKMNMQQFPEKRFQLAHARDKIKTK